MTKTRREVLKKFGTVGVIGSAGVGFTASSVSASDHKIDIQNGHELNDDDFEYSLSWNGEGIRLRRT